MKDLKIQYDHQLKEIEKKHQLWITLFVINTIIFIFLLYRSISISFQKALIPVFLLYFVIMIFTDKINQQKNTLQSRLNVINRYEAKKRYELDKLDSGANIDHSIYLEDLDIVGKHSLFQYLNCANTIEGKRKLIKRFENTDNDLLDYQEAILEFKEQKELMIEIQSNLKEDLSLKALTDRMNFSTQKVKGVLLIDFLLDILIIFSFCRMNVQYACILFVLHYLISSFYSMYYSNYFKGNEDTFLFLNHLKIKISTNFHSKKLSKIQDDYNKMIRQFKVIDKLDILYALDHNILSSLLGNGFFSLRLWIVYFYNTYLETNIIKEWCEDYSELEMLTSLSSLFILQTHITKAEVSDHFEIINGIHPLVINCIPNSLSENSVTIITGSNMSGKTSFLRMIGINLILMNAGGFCLADSLKSPIYRVVTSMRIQDNLSKGISTFLGELKRVKEALDYDHTQMVLIDEIFKGTNYQDRITGAKEVIHKLQDKKCSVLITTHDFQLCEEKGVANYYFKEEYINDEIVFDYKIHKGISNTSNALYLMKKIGIIGGENH